jgi:hypothetical protein
VFDRYFDFDLLSNISPNNFINRRLIQILTSASDSQMPGVDARLIGSLYNGGQWFSILINTKKIYRTLKHFEHTHNYI